MLSNKLINGLIGQNPIDVPASAVEKKSMYYVTKLHNVSVAMRNKRHNYHVNYLKLMQNVVFKSGLLFSEVIKSNELKADEERAKQ